MNYRKQPHTRLHHTETHKHDDGSYRVEAHVIHRPPSPAKQPQKAGEVNAYAYASPHDNDYPNKVIKHGATDWEEATEAHRQILEAHQHEGGHRKPHVAEKDYEHGNYGEGNDHDGDE
jgi:hypothetical protein